VCEDNPVRGYAYASFAGHRLRPKRKESEAEIKENVAGMKKSKAENKKRARSGYARVRLSVPLIPAIPRFRRLYCRVPRFGNRRSRCDASTRRRCIAALSCSAFR